MLSRVRSVLVVDDSPVVRLALRRALRAAGFEVVERDSVASAADVAPHELACAVLDLELGDGLGVEVAARLRAARPDLPLAFFSSADDEALLERARDLALVFPKPGRLDDVVAWAREAAHPRGSVD
jgi:CheY-like chemotaxis protein